MLQILTGYWQVTYIHCEDIFNVCLVLPSCSVDWSIQSIHTQWPQNFMTINAGKADITGPAADVNLMVRLFPSNLSKTMSTCHLVLLNFLLRNFSVFCDYKWCNRMSRSWFSYYLLARKRNPSSSTHMSLGWTSCLKAFFHYSLSSYIQLPKSSHSHLLDFLAPTNH